MPPFVDQKSYPPLYFGDNQESLLYEDLLGHCVIAGAPDSGKSSAVFLVLAQHVAAGGNFLYLTNGARSNQVAKLLAITGLSHGCHHVHHLRVTPKQPLKPFFVQPFLSGCSSVIVSPSSDSGLPISDSDHHAVATASLNLLSLKFTRNSAYANLPRILVVDKADSINDRLLSDVLMRAKMSGVAVILLMTNPVDRPLALSAIHSHILLRDPSTTADTLWGDISGMPIQQSRLSDSQAYVFAKKGYPTTPLIRNWSPFHIPIEAFQ